MTTFNIDIKQKPARVPKKGIHNPVYYPTINSIRLSVINYPTKEMAKDYLNEVLKKYSSEALLKKLGYGD